MWSLKAYQGTMGGGWASPPLLASRRRRILRHPDKSDLRGRVSTFSPKTFLPLHPLPFPSPLKKLEVDLKTFLILVASPPGQHWYASNPSEPGIPRLRPLHTRSGPSTRRGHQGLQKLQGSTLEPL